MWKALLKLASFKHFYRFSGKLLPWLAAITLVLFAIGLYWGLVVAPVDYQQKDSYRIIYIHVPAAWMSLFVYIIMAIASATHLVWKTKLSEVIATQCAPIGAVFTVIALFTGAIWGQPTWGTWWVWDARLTSELILLFLYLGYIALHSAIEDQATAARAAAILAIVGVVNIPIIHYSVDWWFSLHQSASVSISKGSSLHPSMLWPLMVMATAFKFYFATVLLMRTRNEILERDQQAKWVAEEERLS
jgi:heme exporter protein C